MEREVIESELVLPTYFNFKKIQVYDKYPKGQPRGRWKQLKQLKITPISPPTNPIAPYVDPRTKLRYANTEVFKLIRSLPDDYVQRYLALRNAAVTLR